MENESAKLETNLAKQKKSDKESENKLNKDIRAFFPKSTGPSIMTTNKRIIKVIEPYINEIDENNYKLRERKIINYKHKFEPSDDSNSEDLGELDNEEIVKNKPKNDDFEGSYVSGEDSMNLRKKKKRGKISKNKSGKKKVKKQKKEKDDDDELFSENTDSIVSKDNSYDSDFDYIELRGVKVLTKFKTEAHKTIKESELETKKLLKEFYINEHKISETKSKYPDFCVPISADIRDFKFKTLAEKQLELTGKLFEVIMMDPPWQLSSSQPTRGVAIAYDTLNDNIITDIPVDKLQTDGFIFIWTINAKFKVTLDLLKEWGYKYCDEIVWVKQTVNGKIAKGHGYYLQHTKETCLIGVKGNPTYNKNVLRDVIFSKRRGQSQKPEEIYEIIERLCPKGCYLEIFGRRNNLRDYWVTIGNEI